jgi:small redox-active disulfide protein 2
MNIKVLGTGCAKCQALEKTTREAIKELGIDVEFEYIKDIKKIMEYPILSTPGLVIDEKLVVSGRVPSKAEVTTFITTALDK